MSRSTFDANALQQIIDDPTATDRERTLAMNLLQVFTERVELRVMLRTTLTFARRLATELNRPADETARLQRRVATMCDTALEYLAR